MHSHSGLVLGWQNWVGLDWPTRYGWLRLADEAVFDLRMSVRHNAVRRWNASAETGANQGGSAEPACGSRPARPMPESAHGAGWLNSGLCAIPIGRSPRHKQRESMTAQFGSCANTSHTTQQRAAS